MSIPREPMGLATNKIHQKSSFNILQNIGFRETEENHFFNAYTKYKKPKLHFTTCQLSEAQDKAKIKRHTIFQFRL